MRPRLAPASVLYASVVSLLRPRRRLPRQRPLIQAWSGQPASRWVAVGAIAVLALSGSATPAGPHGPAVPALVALDPEGLQPGAAFGTSVAAAGRILVVGAPLLGGGAAYVYTYGSRGWREAAELRGSGTQAGDFFGGAVAVWGTTVVVGADEQAGAGRAYVFSQDGQGWRGVAELTGSGEQLGAGFGFSVAIGASTIVVGAPTPVLGAGTAYVFRKGPQGWGQVAELRAQGAPVGGDFGFSVAASGPVAVVGAPGDMRGAGRAYVFSRVRGGWRQSAELAGGDTGAGDNFGFSVAESTGQVLVGAPWRGAGAAYLFRASVRGWHQSGEVRGQGTQARDRFGSSVALGPRLAVVGAPAHNAGRAYVFIPASGGWRQAGELAGPSAPGCDFGTATGVSGGSVVIGANGYGSGTGAAWTTLSWLSG